MKHSQQRERVQAPRKPQKLRIDNLLTFEPLTDSQAKVYTAWDGDSNIVLNGSAGSGKTFTALYLALEEVLDKGNSRNKVLIVRSAEPTKNIGFLPGTEEEKTEVYNLPYKAICTELFEDATAYEKLKDNDQIEFMSTSYIRGITITDSIVIVDEMQNLSFHELDSIITRIGDNSKIIFCGDYYQSDLARKGDRDGILKFMEILKRLNNFDVIEFTWADIVRSGLVRDYIMTKELMESEYE